MQEVEGWTPLVYSKTNDLYLRLRNEGEGDRAKGRVNVADSLALIFLRECKWAQGKSSHLKRKFQIEVLVKVEERKAEQGPGSALVRGC